MVKIAICDDDQKDMSIIKKYIEEYAEENPFDYTLKMFESGERLLERDYVPNVLFLDIFMGKKDGIQIGSEIRKGKDNIIIIYTTNLKEKMVEAFNQIHSFGFLTKPINKEDFFKMLKDALDKTSEKEYIHTMSFATENNTYIQLPVMDIFYFEYLERRVRIVTRDRGDIFIKDKINNIANKMKGYGFTMSHQSFVVNLYHVDKYRSQGLLMKNGDIVCLAQKRASTVRKEMMQLVKETIENGGRKVNLQIKDEC